MEDFHFTNLPVVMFDFGADFISCFGPFCFVCLAKAGGRRHDSASTFDEVGDKAVFLKVMMLANLAKVVKVL